jgi:hypothetical protein
VAHRLFSLNFILVPQRLLTSGLDAGRDALWRVTRLGLEETASRYGTVAADT